MTKITLNNLNNLQNENTAVNTINGNNSTIVSAFDNTLSRDGSNPNQMESDFDMNSNDILNVDKISAEHVFINGSEIVTSDLSSLAPIPDGEIFSNISGAPAIPIGNNLQSILDKEIGTTNNSLLYRGASNWNLLSPGSSGKFLSSQGSDLPPSWTTLPAGGDMFSIRNLSDVSSILQSRMNLGFSVLDRTALKALDPTNITEAYLDESGREGMFVFKSGNYSALVTADTLQGVYIASNTVPSSSGAWVRIYQEFGYPEWFGATGDGVTDDSAAFNAALLICKKVRLKDPTSGYYIGSTVTFNQPYQSIVGVPTRTKIIHKDGYDLFHFQSGDTEIHNLWIDDTGVVNMYYDVVVQTSITNLDRVLIQNIISDQAKGFMKDDGGSYSATTVTIADCTLKRQSGPGFYFSKIFAYLNFFNVTIDFVNSIAPNYNAWNITSNQGCIFDNCDVTGTATGSGVTNSQAGFVITSCSAIWFRKTQADSVQGLGYSLTSCNGVQMYDAMGGLNNGNAAFYFNGCYDVTGAIRAYGRNGISGAASSINGVVMSSCTRVRLDIQSVSWTGDGVNISGSFSVLITSLQSQGHVGWGLKTDNTGSVAVGTCSFGGNTAGNYNIGAAAHGISFAQLNSGAFVHDIVGPGSA